MMTTKPVTEMQPPTPAASALSEAIVSSQARDQNQASKWSTANIHQKRKSLIVAVGFLLVINSTLGSSISSGCIPFFQKDFQITSQVELVLPNSMYLLGYVFGPPLFGPLSELIGRRLVLQFAFFGFTIFTLASALAPNWPSLIVFRLMTGILASAPISVVGGMYADVFDDPVQRGRAITFLVGGTTIAPVVGPIISGFVAPISWRWTYWISAILAGILWPVLIFLPETYHPVLIRRNANANNAVLQRSADNKTTRDIMVTTLFRPIRLLAEPMVLSSCVYLAFEYALFYIFFVAYPVVFQGIYRMNDGVAALPLLPIGLGAALACGVTVYYDEILRRAKLKQVQWAHIEEYRRLPMACLGGPLHVIALFWLGWSARSDVHWIVPTLAGIPFGIGVELTFISLLNYLTDAYGIYAASVLATSTFTRSISAVLLPLCVDRMYATLGVPWSFSLLGFVSLSLALAPFVMLRYGSYLRDRSKFCQAIHNEEIDIALRESTRAD